VTVRFNTVVALALTVVTSGSLSGQQTAPQALKLTGEIAGTHDPSIAVDHGMYYVFATGAVRPIHPEGVPLPAPTVPGQPRPARPSTAQLPQFQIRCSPDLHVWKHCGAVFPAIPAWIQAMSPKTEELWAPDISYFNGLYHLYYAFSLFGKNTSGIALATNETLNPTDPRYKWADRGLVFRSTATNDYNAIDPNLILDKKGNVWLAFGSFWTGVKMWHIDRKTGLLSHKDLKLYSLASRGAATLTQPRNPALPPDGEAIEAPFIFRHGYYYYLFVSWDLCCRGVKSTYRTMVGRSANVTGSYVDRTGKLMLRGGGTPVLVGNSKWLGPGGESLLHLPNEDLIVFHAYSAMDGHPELHISTLGWKDGWPESALEGDGR
jgi:arabinan endo-1,5-alpha-L-arabinosidase